MAGIVLYVADPESLRQGVLTHEEADTLGVLVVEMERNADHARDHLLAQGRPIPPLCDFIRIEREAVNSSCNSGQSILAMPAIRE